MGHKNLYLHSVLPLLTLYRLHCSHHDLVRPNELILVNNITIDAWKNRIDGSVFLVRVFEALQFEVAVWLPVDSETLPENTSG